MAYDFNAAEIFEVAIRIEENGAAFYRKAAQLQADASNQDFLGKLASMEDVHKVTFVEMKDRITEAEKSQTVFDPHGELSLYLSSMADSHGGEGSPAAADSLTGKETMEEIISIAIGLEKNSILFYLGLRDMVPPKLGREKIDDIIREERKHIAQLTTLHRKIVAE
ncbi:MAG: ferritin family protein [Thermodesulfobacteriota bacterium]|nr:ferritin family protein [Thermodesulfobacteriota bacterium]